MTGFALHWHRSTFLEEVGESSVPAPVRAEASAAGIVVQPQVPLEEIAAKRLGAEDQPLDTGEAQMMMVSEAGAERRDTSPPSSELSTGKMNPRAPGWNKRFVHCSCVSATATRCFFSYYQEW
jgi:hypothetical protein